MSASLRNCIVAAVVLLAAGCATPAVLEVPTGPGTSYPCGVGGVVCTTQKACCDPGDTCGGEPESVGCPAGECCFVEPNDMMAARQPRKQRPQAPQ